MPSFAAKKHGTGIYHALYLELGAGALYPVDPFFDWDVDGWL